MLGAVGLLDDLHRGIPREGLTHQRTAFDPCWHEFIAPPLVSHFVGGDGKDEIYISRAGAGIQE
jgi:hypothetical protein